MRQPFYLCLFGMLLATSFAQAQNFFDIFSYRNPRPEPKEKQMEILKSWGVKPTNTYDFNWKYADSLTQSTNYSFDLRDIDLGTFSPIQFRVFSGSGAYYTGWASCFGSLKKLNILRQDSIVDIESMPLNRQLTLDENVNLISNHEEALLKSFKDYDYVILAFWAGYNGRSCRRMLRALETFVSNNTTKKVLLVKVNYNGV